MTIKKIILLIAILFALNPVFAKDQTHEKPDEFPEPDTHRIFIRGLIGFGSYTIPEVGEGRTASSALTALSAVNGIASLGSDTTKSGAGATQSNQGLEYRFKDAFRILYDKRSTTVLASNSYASFDSFGGDSILTMKIGNYDWQEDVTKTGIAYFHPITNRFNLGFYLRNYIFEQGYGLSGFGFLGVNASGFTGAAVLNSGKGSYSKATGLVPGLGFEYKIFRWLDFTYSFERFNLKGTKTDLTLDILLGNPGLLIIGASLSDFMVVGTAQNAGFIFKYSTWFSTKFGVISEKYVRTYNSNYTLSDDPTTILVGSLLYSSIVQSTSTLNNAYWQFEFSKGF